jgi:hypothetical protein
MKIHRFTKSLCLGFVCAALLAACNDDDVQSSGPPPSSSAALSFRMDAGGQINAFYRQDQVAAHLLVRSSTKPRLLVVLPAGNSGTGLWFDDTAQPVNWSLDTPPSALSAPDAHGRPLYGIGADVSVDTDTLTIRQGCSAACASCATSTAARRSRRRSSPRPPSRAAPRNGSATGSTARPAMRCASRCATAAASRRPPAASWCCARRPARIR